MQVIRFAVLGAASGSLYALIALGIVLTYRASGVLNFAVGAVGAVGAFVFYNLRDDHHQYWVLALLIGLGVGALVGVITQILVMRVLRQASTVAKLIATLGVLSAVQGLAVIKWGPGRKTVRGFLPKTPVKFGNNFSITEDRLLLIGLAVVLAVLLRLVYSRTRFGLATSAVAENRRAAAGVGWSTNIVETVNFAVAGTLAALAAILVAPIIDLQVLTITLLVIPALAAALVGGFSSFALTVAGATIIGVFEAEFQRYFKSPSGLGETVPLLVIVAVTVLGGRARPARGDISTRLPLPGTGRITLAPMLAGAAITAVVIFQLSPSWVDAFTTTLAVGVLVLSVVVVTGYGGQLSLSQFALAGFGVWVAARLVATQGLPFWLAAIAGVVLTVPVGLVVALPALRTRGVNLAVATLGLALMIQAMILEAPNLTGGLDGTKVGSPHLFGFNLDPIRTPQRYSVFCLVVFVLAALVVANIRRGRTGRRLIAVRSNERAAAALGIGVYGAKLYAFGVAAALAAAAGILLGFRTPTVVFSQFTVMGSINVVEYAVIGGLGWASGAIIGASLAAGTVFAKVLETFFGASNWLLVLGGASVVLILAQNPNGLAEMYSRLFGRHIARLRVPRSARAGSAATLDSARRRRAPVTLVVKELTVRFGGVVALDNFDMVVHPGEVVGLIGPNGAGKTTLLDAVTGFNKPARGQVLLDGVDIGSWSPVKRARAGLSRSFQAVELFEELTVRENLLVAADRHSIESYARDLVRPRQQNPTALMAEIIEEFELGDVLGRRPAELPQGTSRLVGIARAVLAEPSVLFLDEPAAGLDAIETRELGRLVRRIATDRGISIVLVEHDVAMVLATCDRISVLDFGHRIAEGTPEAIRTDGAVIAAYLGADSYDAGDTPVAIDLSVTTTNGSVPSTREIDNALP